MAAALERVARDAASDPVEAVVVISDGVHNLGDDPRRLAATMAGLPALVVPVGNPQPVRDVVLHHVEGPRTVFKDDIAVIEGAVDAFGCRGEEVVVSLLEDDVPVDEQRFFASGDSFVRRVRFSRKAETLGQHTYRVRVEPLPDERLEDNNQADVTVEVMADTIRVLLADRLPRWEFRYLYQLFRRDDRVEFQVVQFEPRKSDGRPARGTGLPRTAEGWGAYRVAILGDLTPQELTAAQLEMLEEFVSRKGGTAIIIAGGSMPQAFGDERLARLLPVTRWPGALSDDQGFELFLTGQGRATPELQLADSPTESERIWREVFGRLPVYGLSPWCRAKPAAHSLIGAWPQHAGQRQRDESDQRPTFLAWHRFGRGRVVTITAPMTYQLRYRQGDLYHHRFWGQLLRWAVAETLSTGSSTVRITSDKADYAAGEDVRVSVQLSGLDGSPVTGAACRAEATQGGESLATVELAEDAEVPGLYTGTINGLPSGPVTVRPQGAEIDRLLAEEDHAAAVETVVRIAPPDSLEMRDTRCNLPLLEQVAEATNGAVVPPAGLAAAIGQLDLEPEVHETVSRQPIWATWPLLWLFVGCLSVEWIVRKAAGRA